MATPTVKMNYNPTMLLNTHFLLLNLSQPDQIDVQEVVDYCEARFCFVLQVCNVGCHRRGSDAPFRFPVPRIGILDRLIMI